MSGDSSQDGGSATHRNIVWVVTGLLMLGWVIRIYIGWNFPSIYWPDEIFQTVEQAHRALFGYGIVPWEYEDGVRSWLFPGFLAGVMWLTEPLASGSKGYLFGVTAVLTLFSLIPAYVVYRWGKRDMRGIGIVVAVVVPLVWMEANFFAPKPLFEVFTIHLFVGGIYLFQFANGSWWRPLIGGIFMGLCCAMRLQMAPAAVMVVAATPWIATYPHRRFSAVVIGVAVGVGMGGLVDAVVLGAPFQSMVSNYYVNLIEGKASTYGTSPWWQYGAWIWQVSPVSALLVGAGLVAGIVWYPTLGWPAAALLVAHSLVSHKEYRFLYPVIVLSTMALGLVSGWVIEQVDDWLSRQKFGVLSSWGAVGLAVFVVAGSAAVSIEAASGFNLRSDGDTGAPSNWRLHGGRLLAYRHLSTKPDVCGVGLHGHLLVNSGAYGYLHHDVPLVKFGWSKNPKKEIQQHGKAVNYIVSGKIGDPDFEVPGSFENTRCLEGYHLCIFSRPGDCRRPESKHIIKGL